jgi:demethoxyubiquinone hydroxylase (CLK1/Coq7/Cat5 family)
MVTKETKMELDELNKLEEKVKHLVDNLKQLKEENRQLIAELEQTRKDSSTQNEERLEIKKKVTTLIQLIDSLEK